MSSSVRSLAAVCFVAVGLAASRPQGVESAAAGFPGTLPQNHATSSTPSSSPSSTKRVRSRATKESSDYVRAMQGGGGGVVGAWSDDSDDGEMTAESSSSDFEDLLASDEAAKLGLSDGEAIWNSERTSSSESGSKPQSNVEIRESKPSGRTMSAEANGTSVPNKSSPMSEADGESAAGSSQPLRTLKKLQDMLEETDYATATTAATVTTASAPYSDDSSDAESMGIPEDDLVEISPTSEGGNTAVVDATEAENLENALPDRLWTSKDRSKYRRQQQRRREEQERQQLRQKWLRQQQKEQQRQERRRQVQLQQREVQSDGEGTDETDDGLGYTLPNLPAYFSDAEGTESEPEDQEEPRTPVSQQQQQQQRQIPRQQTAPQQTLSQQPPQQQGQGPPYHYQPHPQQFNYPVPPNSAQQGQQSQHQPPQQQSPQHQPPQPMGYPGYFPVQPGSPLYAPQQYGGPANPYSQQQQGPANPYSQQQAPANTYSQQQQHYAAQQYAAWAAATGSFPYGPSGGYPNYPRPMSQTPYGPGFVPQPYVPRGPAPPQGAMFARSRAYPKALGQKGKVTAKEREGTPSQPITNEASSSAGNQVSGGSEILPENAVVSLAEVGKIIVSFDSMQKIAFVLIGVTLLSYCAVSPRNLPLVDYNSRFKANLRLVSLATIAPIITSLCVFDAEQNDINAVVNTFYASFTMGYIVSFLLEIVFTTILRLGVFALWEPAVFDLTPKVPALVLPWVLRENKYKPKRITLFAADFATSCVASPIIEEYVKLKVVQLSVRLPRNFKWSQRKKGKRTKKKKKKRVCEAIVPKPGEPEVTNINSYVTHLLAASLGLKLCDSARRILMYTKKNDTHKSFYAMCRGIFPIHELCGTLTALALARRDVLGMDLPNWQILAPAVIIHGMANFRGMKPIFKWNSATPWSEMQLFPWNFADDATLSQIINKSFAKLMWLSILGRVLGSCVKNYYLIGRQAVKRTTTYSGNHAAFTAELAAAEMLKKSKD